MEERARLIEEVKEELSQGKVMWALWEKAQRLAEPENEDEEGEDPKWIYLTLRADMIEMTREEARKFRLKQENARKDALFTSLWSVAGGLFFSVVTLSTAHLAKLPGSEGASNLMLSAVFFAVSLLLFNRAFLAVQVASGRQTA